MAWFVYVLLCDQKTYYVGIAEKMSERFKEHVSGYSPFTHKFSDFELVYQEKLPSRTLAEKREQQLKGWSIAKKKALIAGDFDKLKILSKGQ
ncbi:MAG TPA: GIY-YIG nuclease family protein [Candidatus Paceibacterota bacterium]